MGKGCGFFDWCKENWAFLVFLIFILIFFTFEDP